MLTGQSLIRAAELRSVTTEYEKYTAAVHTFRDKYFALPGDMTNATSFWGSATCPGTAGTGTQTCNGNGEGHLNAPASPSQFGEQFTFWQHLANAGLISGSFTGMALSGSVWDAQIGVNVPASKMTKGGWYISWVGDVTVADNVLFEGSYGNPFHFGGQRPSSSPGIPVSNELRPEEAWQIDVKIDDGKPGIGTVRLGENDTNCHDQAVSTTTNIASVAQYELTNSDISCYLIFLSGW